MTYINKIPVIRFNGLPKLPVSNKLYEFGTKENYDNWYKSCAAGLAELDEAMNYCKYFVREHGNTGNYIREGKSFPVDGSWIGNQDFDNYPPCQSFVKWLTENGWRTTWYELMDKYKEHQSLTYTKPVRV